MARSSHTVFPFTPSASSFVGSVILKNDIASLLETLLAICEGFPTFSACSPSNNKVALPTETGKAILPESSVVEVILIASVLKIDARTFIKLLFMVSTIF